MPNFIQALQQLRSRNQTYKQQVVEQVLARSGLTNSKAINAIHELNKEASSTLAQSIYDQDVDTDKVKYAASWFGLLTDSPHTLVFKAQEGGPDSIYKFHIAGDGNKVTQLLDSHELHQRVLLPTSSGFDVLIHDANRQLRNNVTKLVNTVGVQPQETEGVSEFLGDADKAKSRDAYRKYIKAYEGQNTATEAK